MALTDAAIRTLKPGAKGYKAADEKLLVTQTAGRFGGSKIDLWAAWSGSCRWGLS